MEISFQGKRALVTGAGQGIGKQIALRLAKHGATVFALSKTKGALDLLKKEDSRIQIITVDLGDWDAARKAVTGVLPIDLLVNNAAVASLTPFLNVKEEEVDLLLNVNVKALFNVSQMVAVDMKNRKARGSIVNLSSQASIAGLKDHAVYCATKGAVDALSRAMALELGPLGIRTNTVNPTVVMTEMGKLGWSDPKIAKGMLDKIPLGRFAEVEEVVDAIMFLLSDKSSMINGVALPIDGGFTAT